MYLKLLYIVCFFCESCLLQHFNVPVFIDKSVTVPRIIEGKTAKLGDVPYQVAFKQRLKSSHHVYATFCGGAIIAPKKILTAAHCFHERSVSNACDFLSKNKYVISSMLSRTKAVAGNLKNEASIFDYEGQWVSLSNGVYPKDFKFPRADIAVITTSTPFRYNNHVKPIPMATRHIEYSMKCLASGYGRLSHTKNYKSPHLFLAEMDIVPTVYCNIMHKRKMNHFVCTTSKIPDTAKGDSGGPLVCKSTGDPNDKGEGVLVGLVSGHRVGTGSFFTRVSSYIGFVSMHSTGTRNANSICCVFFTIYVAFCLF